MNRFVGLCYLILSSTAFAVDSPVPAEFVGVWVPLGNSCSAKSGLRVERTSVTLFNGSDSQQFGNLDICYSCEGGARYSGTVVWLLPEFKAGGRTPFRVRFNAHEEKGVAIVEMEPNDLNQRFPLHNVKLQKCDGKT